MLTTGAVAVGIARNDIVSHPFLGRMVSQCIHILDAGFVHYLSVAH